MDLLGGYGSDGSSSSSSGDDAATAPAPPSVSLKSLSEPVMESSRRTRGKRLVSLHAVLPTHIMDQLTQASAGVTGLLDSDDEEPEAARQPPKKKSTSVVGKDEGLSSLLSELKSAPTTNTFLHSGSAGDILPPSQPPGKAFMATTETVVVTNKDKDSVVDIHAKQPESASHAERSESETVADAKPKAALPTAIRPESAPRPSSSVSVPRPSGMSRPVVSAPLTAAAAASTQTQQLRPPQQQVTYQAPEPEQTIDPRLAKKRSRKEMEKALREGNMSAIEGITTLEAEAAVYVPQEETYRVPTHGITKVAPVSMYDPKAGTDVVQANVTGKQRGKHQINQLLASAANLELQRARAMGVGTVKSKRADAKRKYGW